MWFRKQKPSPPRQIDLNAFCPACGHEGCTLEFRAPVKVEVGDKREVRTEPPCVIRKCKTCGALASEKTVLEPDKWIAT
jgi:hypothetical protein